MPTYRFAEFSLDPPTRQLQKNRQPIHLSPKAFDLLTLLVENRSRPVTRAELHKHLWPDTYVQDTNLASLIAEIRRALDDDAESPRFVRTVHRFGYWFIGAMDDEAADQPVPAAVRYWLVWESRQVALGLGENVIGRAPEAAVWIDARGVSRMHARIMVSADEATIEDLGSKNGTYVRGERVNGPTRLADGDEIRLGAVVLTLRIPGPARATDTVVVR